MTPRELESAIQRLLDGNLPPEEFDDLKAALKADPEAIETYLDSVDLHLLLAARAGSHHDENPLPQLVETTLQLQQRKAKRISLLAAAAAFIVLGIVLRLTLVPDAPPVLSFRTGPDTLLEISHLDENPDPGTLAVGSRVIVHQGFVECTFASGVRSIVKGPADLTLHEDDHLYLASGQAWFHVPKPAVGFQVRTRETLVTDLGTEFAVISTESASDEVHVLSGRVRITNLNGLKKEGIATGGQARLIGPAGRLFKTPLRRGEFATILPDSLPHLHWSFDGTDPLEASGTHHAASGISTTTPHQDASTRLTDGKHGHGLLFHAPTDSIRTDWDGFQGSAPRSFACWIKLHPNQPEGWTSIVEWGGHGGPGDPLWRVRVAPENDHSTDTAVLRVSFGASWVDGTTNLADGKWHHIAVTQSGTRDAFGFPELRFYVDGLEEQDLTYLPGTRPNGDIATRSGRPLVIGRHLSDHRILQGSIDELFLFEGTLSPASIRRLMTTHQP